MKEADVVTIGGSIGGRVAAITARRHYKDAKIILIKNAEKVLVPCPIPYIFGTLKDPEKNLFSDAPFSEDNIDLVVDEATLIDRKKKTISTLEGDFIKYRKLILATGSMPIVPKLPGINLKNVFFAKKDVDYLNRLSKALDGVEDVVVIGGGFIGVEFSDQFRKRGLNVTIIEMLPHCLQLVFDEDFCIMAEDKIKELGIDIMTNSKVKAIIGEKAVEGVELEGGEKIKADIVFLGIGVIPNILLAEKAGIKIGETRAIWVDEYGRTSDEDIFAIGDCAEKKSFFTKKPSALRLASIATHEARIAGANLFELKRKNEGAIGTFATVIGDFALGMSGLSERMAKDAGFDVVVGEASGPDKHPPAMPDTKQIRMRLIFEKTSGKILGGQFCGGSSSGEIANILAALIQKRMVVDDIVTFQMGTHPVLTPSPGVYPIVNAAEDATVKLKQPQ